MNLWGSEQTLSTGGLEEDSVLISYNDLRVVNAKLIELNYEKNINNKLKDIIHNDSLLIDNLYRNNRHCEHNQNKIKKERDISLIGCAISVISTLAILIFK